MAAWTAPGLLQSPGNTLAVCVSVCVRVWCVVLGDCAVLGGNGALW